MSAKLYADIMRAEAASEDLQEDDAWLVICAMREDGSLYELGRVSAAAVYQDPEGARMAISQIKFGRRTTTQEQR